MFHTWTLYGFLFILDVPIQIPTLARELLFYKRTES